ncbi:MAG TPA: di-heme oxidoredictase family protein, partial [Burkholderiales bacterium]|nr:di-heme oxidoredictase family protein [Burkholderiales bacterium]
APTPDAGDLTVDASGAGAYSLPAPGLDAAQLETFANGRQEFHQHWVVLPVIGGKWGRGPTSNGEECSGCHAGNGRGRAPGDGDEALVSMVVRLSVPGEDEHGGPAPHPAYGDQLQEQGELGRVPAEGEASIAWTEREEVLADGTRVALRAPKVAFRKLAFGPMGDDALVSPRIAPPVIGAGLLDAVPDSQLLAIAASQRALGFNGRPNRVWDAQSQTLRIGRFGWKANQPSLRQQVASAYLADLGVTTELYPSDNCPAVQTACRKRPGGTVPEQTWRPFEEILFYLRALGVPQRRDPDAPAVQRGAWIFEQVQCAACHVPELRTGEYPAFPRLSNQMIRPYTDLLLHDMGEGLADGRPDFRAGGRDWRTPPLWGLGLREQVNGNGALLHDGRARTLAEAVLWHGGEAAGAREGFRQLPARDRAALFAFLESL